MARTVQGIEVQSGDLVEIGDELWLIMQVSPEPADGWLATDYPRQAATIPMTDDEVRQAAAVWRVV